MVWVFGIFHLPSSTLGAIRGLFLPAGSRTLKSTVTIHIKSKLHPQEDELHRFWYQMTACFACVFCVLLLSGFLSFWLYGSSYYILVAETKKTLQRLRKNSNTSENSSKGSCYILLLLVCVFACSLCVVYCIPVQSRKM